MEFTASDLITGLFGLSVFLLIVSFVFSSSKTKSKSQSEPGKQHGHTTAFQRPSIPNIDVEGLSSKYAELLDRIDQKLSQIMPINGDANKKQILGLAGGGLLLVGVFLPIISAPFLGKLNYFHNGKGDGVIVLILALITLYSIFSNRYKNLWLTGLGSLGMLLFTFINFQLKTSQVKAHLDQQLAGNPFRGIADMAAQSIQLQYGWLVLIAGAMLVLASAAMRIEKQ